MSRQIFMSSKHGVQWMEEPEFVDLGAQYRQNGVAKELERFFTERGEIVPDFENLQQWRLQREKLVGPEYARINASFRDFCIERIQEFRQQRPEDQGRDANLFNMLWAVARDVFRATVDEKMRYNEILDVLVNLAEEDDRGETFYLVCITLINLIQNMPEELVQTILARFAQNDDSSQLHRKGMAMLLDEAANQATIDPHLVRLIDTSISDEPNTLRAILKAANGVLYLQSPEDDDMLGKVTDFVIHQFLQWRATQRPYLNLGIDLMDTISSVYLSGYMRSIEQFAQVDLGDLLSFCQQIGHPKLCKAAIQLATHAYNVVPEQLPGIVSALKPMSLSINSDVAAASVELLMQITSVDASPSIFMSCCDAISALQNETQKDILTHHLQQVAQQLSFQELFQEAFGWWEEFY